MKSKAIFVVTALLFLPWQLFAQDGDRGGGRAEVRDGDKAEVQAEAKVDSNGRLWSRQTK